MKYSLLSKIVIILIFMFYSCEKILIQSPDNNPSDIFESLWEDFDYHYPRFEIINTDWDSIYNIYKPRINNSMDEEELFDIISEMLDQLNDGHVWLKSEFKEFYGTHDRTNFEYSYVYETIENYLNNIEKQYMFTYGYLTNNTGYIHISTFTAIQNGYEYIDNILNEFEETSSIVFDIRANAGGLSTNAEIVASRFYDKKRKYSYGRYRNGPEHNDFSKKAYFELEPKGNRINNKNIIVLTDRSVGSSGEDFVLMMEVLPYVTLVGDITSGNSGGFPVWRELQNGWLYYMPTGLEYSMNNVCLYYTGIVPDINVEFTYNDINNGTDPLLEKAIEILN